MDVETVATLYDYNCWATWRVLDAARKTGDAAFTAPRPEQYYGSLSGTLVHILSAEWIWRQRAAMGVSPEKGYTAQDFPTVNALADRWAEEQDAMRAYIAGLTNADLQKTIAYQSTKGQPFQNTLWHILAHVINHGVQHRSEAAMLLTELGCSPGDLDMILYFREL